MRDNEPYEPAETIMGRINFNSTPCKVCHYEPCNCDPLKTQVGGSHYKDFKIQPIEFITANNLSFLQGSIVKRITRYNHPTGKGIQDIEKIKHECSLIIKFMEE